jgi:hypothetical protein
MKPDSHLERGDLVQLNPFAVRQSLFAGCIMVVTEPKSWGAQGYIQIVGENEKPGGQAYYRAKWEEIELVGRAHWIAE